MPKKSDRTKKKKFRKTGSGTKRIFVKDKPGKHKCALCPRVMHGTPHGKTSSQVRKLAKTKRRPTALFAGILCNKCRGTVVEEVAKIEAGAKSMNDVELRLRKYVKQVKVL